MSDSNTGKSYYLAEATWGSGVFVKPWDYNIVGSAVGDSPRADLGVLLETPGLNKNDDLFPQKGHPYIHPSE
jgi:hypothetical protein